MIWHSFFLTESVIYLFGTAGDVYDDSSAGRNVF